MARRERNIYKRKDGRFEARYIKERDSQGKAKYSVVYARTYAEVKIKLEQAKSTVSKNTSDFKTHTQTIVENWKIICTSCTIRLKCFPGMNKNG